MSLANQMLYVNVCSAMLSLLGTASNLLELQCLNMRTNTLLMPPCGLMSTVHE